MNREKNRLYLFAAIMATMCLAFACGGGGSDGGGSDDNRIKVTAKGVDFYLIEVPAGEYKPGSGSNIPVDAFLMAQTEVTQELWYAVMENKPSSFTSNPEDSSSDGWKFLPVERVSWYDAIAFCNKLSLATNRIPAYSVKISGTTEVNWSGTFTIPSSDDTDWNGATIVPNADGYRLPKEEEWMWAAMGADKANIGQPNVTGYDKAFSGATGAYDTRINDYAWYGNNAAGTTANGKTHQVAHSSKLPNELDLYDMSGNVWEWCWDVYSGSSRVIRGGSWVDAASFCTVAYRDLSNPSSRNVDLGFRVVCP